LTSHKVDDKDFALLLAYAHSMCQCLPNIGLRAVFYRIPDRTLGLEVDFRVVDS